MNAKKRTAPNASQQASEKRSASKRAERNEKDMKGNAGELQQQAGGTHPVLTTQQGIPVPDNQNSLRATPNGPTLLEDFILREKITHFDHERIPERIVHARGSAAHGYFELTDSLSEYTSASILCETGVRTPVFTRFSTVAGGAGSVDTPRDVRGFAVKFYTREGNWDLVGNNIPVFFVQDAMKFPDLIHSVKMEPDRGFPQAASAHDTFWDFVSLTPETMHTLIWAMSDRAIPRSLRMIEGFGVHSFRLINQQGKATFVKFHWRPRLGLQSTLWDEAAKLQGVDNDFHRRDLYEAIQAGAFPEWDFAVQLFTEEDAAQFPFDHLDPTKLIPEELVPLRVIGKMVLDRWPDNLFAETEQVAYCPANVPPGIDFSNDPLLQGRLFSYLDTQLSRLGGSNFAQLPINAPKCPFHHNQRDGHMQMQIPRGRVSYEPSSLAPDSPRASLAQGFRHIAENDTGSKGRLRPESFADHYSQPRQFWRSQNALEQAHIASAFVFELSKVETPHIRTAILGHLQHIDTDLAQRVADGLGVSTLPPPPATAAPVRDLPPSAALGLIDKSEPSLEGRCIGILVSDGSDETHVTRIRKEAEKAGASVKIVAPKLSVTLKDGKSITADGQLAGTPSMLFDAVASVLAPAEGEKLAKDAAAIDWFANAFAHLKAIAACQGSQPILKKANVVADSGVLDISDTKGFIKAAKTRQWEREPEVRTLC